MPRKGLHVTLEALASTSETLRAQSATFQELFHQLQRSEFIQTQRTLSRSVIGQGRRPG
jgi:hypothetical protein